MRRASQTICIQRFLCQKRERKKARLLRNEQKTVFLCYKNKLSKDPDWTLRKKYWIKLNQTELRTDCNCLYLTTYNKKNSWRWLLTTCPKDIYKIIKKQTSSRILGWWPEGLMKDFWTYFCVINSLRWSLWKENINIDQMMKVSR